MAGEAIITVVGNLGDDPELRFTPSGAAVVNMSVCQTPRTLNRSTQEWEDGEPTWFRVNVWREYAEHIAESLTKGQRVIVTGKLKNRPYETREGEKRYSLEIDADEVGPALRYGTSKFTKRPRSGPVREAPPEDPWGAPPAQPGGRDPWAQPAPVPGAQADEPPF